MSDEFFDDQFLAELEELADGQGPGGLGAETSALQARWQAFLDGPGDAPLDEESFVALPPAAFAERTNLLIEICREAKGSGAAQAVEAFVVFVQTLVPALSAEGAALIKRFFFRLAPTLLHVAWNDFGATEGQRADGRLALREMEKVLIEISDVKLAPSESDLVFRSIDQMAGFIVVGDYAMASGIISTQLLSIIQRNKIARALYRLMEVEVSVQNYLKDKLGYSTPRLRVPGDLPHLGDYGPLRCLREQMLGDESWIIQVHIPGLTRLRDVVLRLIPQDSATTFHDLRLDALGGAVLEVPDGTYHIGLIYEPEARPDAA